MKPVETCWNDRLGACQLLLLVEQQEEFTLILTSNLTKPYRGSHQFLCCCHQTDEVTVEGAEYGFEAFN